MNNMTMAPTVAAISSLRKPYVGICNSSASVLPTKDPAMPTSMFVNIPWRDSTTIAANHPARPPIGASALCQIPDSCTAAIISLFNHLISERYAISLGEQCGVGPPRHLSTGSGGAPQLANSLQLRQIFSVPLAAIWGMPAELMTVTHEPVAPR